MVRHHALVAVCIANLMLPSAASAQITKIAKAQTSDPIAQYVKASSWVTTGKELLFVELLLDGKDAALRVRSATNQIPEIQVLNSPSDVLELLADKRVQFLWQPLTEWAGPTLEKMRDQRLAQLRAAAAAGNAELPPTNTTESTVRPKIRSLIQLANFLIKTGQAQLAERLLLQQLGTMKFKTNGSWSAIEWFSVAAWIGTARLEENDFDGAISQYESIERALGNSPYADNATINRASLLAQSGRYADALAVIDPLWIRWSKETREEKVTGSERQFAWIRACALEGLGRHAEAQAAFEPVMQASKTRDPYYVIATDDELKFKGLVCMKQTGAVAELLGDEIQNSRFPRALLLLQPGYRPSRDAEFWDKIRSDPTLAKLASERMRVLPAEMTPALNGWR